MRKQSERGKNMRFNFDFSEADDFRSGDGLGTLTSPSPSAPAEDVQWLPLQDHHLGTLTSPSPSVPAEDVQWLPLQDHPVFAAAADRGAFPLPSTSEKTQTNLLAWDGASRLYFWDPNKRCLHRISIKLGQPDSASILAASTSKVLQADVQINYEVQKISMNRNGSAILLSGVGRLNIMYLFGKTSAKQSTITCHTVTIGSEIYFNSSSSLIHTLQASWHPYSDNHLGILSSDSVFRIFNLNVSLQQPEQEYYLQPVEPNSSLRASSICPADFSFGGNHFWERFSVFVLFSDGSVYVLCPVVPFGSVYNLETLLEIYDDAKVFISKSTNSEAVKNANMAISWLEATFPELSQPAMDGGNLLALKAQPYAFTDSPVVLQGPLHILSDDEKKKNPVQDGECEGRAVSFHYDLVFKDTILIVAWSSGLLQIDALGEDIQPVWKAGHLPRISFDSNNHILGVAMICDTVSSDLYFLKPDLKFDHTVWLGHPPSLLRLSVVDLALPGKGGSYISMFGDPLMPERVYCLHDGGIDSVLLHFLPFTSQEEWRRRSPSVNPVISTCQEESFGPSLCGFLSIADSFGDSWIVGLSYFRECIVLEMESRKLLLPFMLDQEKDSTSVKEQKETEIPTLISKDLLGGPKVVLPPSSNLRSVTADSIEGRSTIHQYYNLFHENYVRYAHKVYIELQEHAHHLKKIIDDQHSRLQKAEQNLLEVEKKQKELDNRIAEAVQRDNVLKERLLKLRNIPGIQKKPLSKAERDFKMELDKFAGGELDALRLTIEALDARLKRLIHSTQANLKNQQSQMSGRRSVFVAEDEISQLKSSISKLSLLNNENTRNAKLIESALKSREISRDH